jgi:D-glycero-D-manno-heptose 1,7-bisphosphate phosphatase
VSGRRAVFLDRDGVINRNREEYVLSWAEFEPIPGAFAAIRRLRAAGWTLVVVTNQSPIGRGLATAAAVDEIHRRMCAQADGAIARVYHCPHRPDEGCACRKPRPGMLCQAIEELGLDPAASWLVGDHPTDAEAAQAAGVRPILVRSGRGNAASDAALAAGGSFATADDLAAAADLILAASQ